MKIPNLFIMVVLVVFVSEMVYAALFVFVFVTEMG